MKKLRRTNRRDRVPDVPPTGRKMSEMVLEFAGTFINAACTLNDKRCRVMEACSAWNMACRTPDIKTKLLDKYLEGYRSYFPDQTDDEMAVTRELMEALVQNKLRLLLNANKLIVNSRVTRTVEGDPIDMASITLV